MHTIVSQLHPIYVGEDGHNDQQPRSSESYSLFLSLRLCSELPMVQVIATRIGNTVTILIDSPCTHISSQIREDLARLTVLVMLVG